jgi:hypothetical protein
MLEAEKIPVHGKSAHHRPPGQLHLHPAAHVGWTLARMVRQDVCPGEIHVTLAEQKIVEEKIEKLLEDLTVAEKAVLYKTLHAEGLRISACDTLIRREPAPRHTEIPKGAPKWALPRGIPPMRVPVP